MGAYLNPGNAGFERICRGDYVDKTGMIHLLNNRIDGPDSLVCISRPRRFGKSYAAKMLCAYYDFSCDSHSLFADKKIAGMESYREHLNRYHVINLDITGFISDAERQQNPLREIPNRIVDAIYRELTTLYPELGVTDNLMDGLLLCVEKTKRKFIFVIDEWDALIREAKNDEKTQKAYLNLLRGWFKNSNFTPQVVAAAYMTGILPIKKDGSQSAISDFIEYPVLYPDGFAPYTGFTEKEVLDLCQKYEMDFNEVRAWYDGYDFPEYGSIYNPYSVMSAMRNKKYRSYWQKTSAAESLLTYISMNFEGLQEIIARLISGEEIEVNTDSFENDFETFRSKDDVLTLLVHLGYLTYHEDTKTVRIPNEEVRIEFQKLLQNTGINQKWISLIQRSQKLLEDTIAGNENAVAAAIDSIRDTQYAPTFYNDEQALRYVIKFAYIAAIEQYLKMEELPSGHGIADVVFLPKQRSMLPALIIELKWDRTEEGAIRQMKNKHYPAVIADFGGDILLAGINYNAKTKKHSCKIETYEKPGSE